jgi:hypothetical protein
MVNSRARDAFDQVGHRAEKLRDIAAHLDDYAVGEGNRQQGRQRGGDPPVTESHVNPLIYWGNGGGTMLVLADEQLDLRAAAQAAIALAAVVERVRVKYRDKAATEATAALNRWAHGSE